MPVETITQAHGNGKSEKRYSPSTSLNASSTFRTHSGGREPDDVAGPPDGPVNLEGSMDRTWKHMNTVSPSRPLADAGTRTLTG
jgi:hypothetical protein